MGVHTGSPQRHEDGYVGLDVQKASRLAGAAHAGQVLASEATARLLGADPDVQLLDLGEHRFKDVAERIRVFQAVSADLASTFPPIRSQGTPGSLPKPLGPTVGRETELAELRTMVLEDERRIVTLTGPGGTGKTRLATALAASVAEHFTDGVYLVPLQAATAADHVWTAMAQVLEIPPDGHIPPGFFGYVADRTTLVVLDNLEQVPDADEVVDVLLREAQHLSIVATSRRPLHVGGEVEYAVPPLSVPPAGGSVDEIGQAAAVQLFVEHASRVRKGFKLGRRQRRRHREALRVPRRPAARDRARRRPGQAAHAQGHPGADRPEPGPRERRARPGRAAAHDPGRDRLELRPPRARPAGRPRPAGRLRVRRLVRGGRGGGPAGRSRRGRRGGHPVRAGRRLLDHGDRHRGR